MARDAGARRRRMYDQHHHQRPAADAGGRRPAAAVRAAAASRSRSTATATRTTGCGRCAAARAPSTGSSRTSAASPAACRIAIGGNFDESSVDSYPALLEFLKRAGLRRQARQGQLQADRPQRRRPTPKGMLPLTPVDAERQAARRHVHDGGRRGRRLGLRLVRLRSTRRWSFLREETKRHGFPTPDGVHKRPVPRAHDARAHHRPRRIALRAAPGSPASWRCRPATSTTGATPWREISAREVRTARPVEGMRRLRVHPGVRRGMPRGIAHTAWRHEHADMSQASFESAVIALAHDVGQRDCLGEYNEDSSHQEGHRQREAEQLLRRASSTSPPMNKK